MPLDLSIHQTITDIFRQKDSIILSQLNDLISRGLLLVEQGEPMLVRSAMEDKIELRQSIKLILKDKEYIEKLEIENKLLKNTISQLETTFHMHKIDLDRELE